MIGPGGKVDAQAIRSAADLEDSGDDDGLRRVSFTLTRDLKKRLDRYLRDRIPFMSRTQLQKLIENEGVLVNGRTPKPSTTLRLGDTVDVVVPAPPPSEIQPEQIPLSVLYEDDMLIVLNKSPDIIVHPARSHQSGTLLNALTWHFQNESSRGGGLSDVGSDNARPGVVHRLDRNTSGVLVFAKQDEAHWKIGRQFEHRTVQKRYLAVVQGRVEPLADAIDLPLGPHTSTVKGKREKYIVRYDELGKKSLTLYRVRESYRTPGGDYSLLELDLKTGRTHQIRVHLSHLGWPIAGDDMYSGRVICGRDIGLEAEGADETLVDRQALHAAMLSFDHPGTGERMTFQAPLPADLAGFVRRLREMTTEPDPAALGGDLDLATMLAE